MFLAGGLSGAANPCDYSFMLMYACTSVVAASLVNALPLNLEGLKRVRVK